MDPIEPAVAYRPSHGGALSAAFALLSVFALLPVAAAQGAAATGVMVQGTGTAYGTPDQAVLTVGVEAVDPNVQTALNEADKAMRAVRQVFLAGGVEAGDIRTATFNVWHEDIRDQSGTVTGGRYHVLHDYQVTVRDLGSVGRLLAGAVQAGANNVQGIQFGLSDPAALRQQARARAMRDAEARAEQLASLAGVTLGRPLRIEESVSNPSPPTPMLRAQAVAAAPVEAGQLAVQVRVSVRYAIE